MRQSEEGGGRTTNLCTGECEEQCERDEAERGGMRVEPLFQQIRSQTHAPQDTQQRQPQRTKVHQ